MKISALARTESPTLWYAECDREALDTSTDDSASPQAPICTITATGGSSHQKNRKKKAILTKLIRGMMKSKNDRKDRISYQNLNKDSDQLNVTAGCDDEDEDKCAKPIESPITEKLQIEEMTVASTPPENLRTCDDFIVEEKHTLTPEEIVLQNEETPKKSNTGPRHQNHLSVDQCLKDIRNFEISGIQHDVGLNAGGEEILDTRRVNSEIDRKLFHKDAEKLKNEKKDDPPVLSVQICNEDFLRSKECKSPEDRVPLPLNPETKNDNTNVKKDQGFTKLEMHDLWDAAKDFMQALDFHDSLKANDLRDKSHFIKEALKKYNIQDCAVDQIIKDTIVVNEPPAEIVVVDGKNYVTSKRALKSGNPSKGEIDSLDIEIGTELRYKTPKRGPKQKQTTVVLADDSKEQCEILTASPLTAFGNENNENLDDSDVFDFHDTPTTIQDSDVEKKAEGESFDVFESKDIVEYLGLNNRPKEANEVYSPGKGKGILDVEDEEDQLRHMINDTVTKQEQENYYEEYENSDDSLLDSSGESFDDVYSPEEERDEIKNSFGSLEWNLNYTSHNKIPVQRKLDFESPPKLQKSVKAEEGLPGILSNTDSSLLSLQNNSIAHSTPVQINLDDSSDEESESSDIGMLEKLEEDCLQRMDSIIANLTEPTSQSGLKKEESPQNSSKKEQDRNEKSGREMISINHEMKQSPSDIMGFPLDEVVKDIIKFAPVSAHEAKAATETDIPLPELLPQDNSVGDGIYYPRSACVDSPRSPNRHARIGEKKECESCVPISMTMSGRTAQLQKKNEVESRGRISKSISERIAQLQKKFKASTQ